MIDWIFGFIVAALPIRIQLVLLAVMVAIIAAIVIIVAIASN
jgi:hypothetical protein